MARPILETGTILDNFTIGERLHKGGMATLWSVTHPDFSIPLLMKIPVIFEGDDPAAIVSFEMEQAIMPRLTGPHVPRFIANGDFTKQPYIVMEQVSGETLLPKLEHLPLTLEAVTAIAIKTACALKSLHKQGLVHLDVKPSNIIMKPRGDFVLIDFGLSHHRDLPDLMAEEFRLPYGTAPYMAPEQVLGVRNDPRSDLFALGVLIYFFATNHRPFGDPQKLKGLKQRIWRDPIPPRQLNPELPEWFQEITLACLEVNAARRPQTAADLIFELQNRDQIKITARGKKQKRDSFFQVLKRKSEPPLSLIDMPSRTEEIGHTGPLMLVALDLNEAYEVLAHEMRRVVGQILRGSRYSRIAILNVLKTNRLTLDTTLDDDGHNKHIQKLVLLKDWAHKLQDTRTPTANNVPMTYHVLESPDPAEAIIEFTKLNNVDHVIMGARTGLMRPKILGRVSAKVVAEAACTVTVVKLRTETEAN